MLCTYKPPNDPNWAIVAMAAGLQNLVWRFHDRKKKDSIQMFHNHIGTCIDVAIVAISGQHLATHMDD